MELEPSKNVAGAQAMLANPDEYFAQARRTAHLPQPAVPVEQRTVPGLTRPVSAIGAGCWTIGGPATNNGMPIGWDDVNDQDAYDGLVTAHELGITLFDTADVYGLGRSERLLGRLLADIDRSSVTVSSKVGYFAGTAAHPYEPAQMCRQFATTLDNLSTDYLDVYFLHSTDFGPDDRYLAEAAVLVHELREQRLIRAIGMRAPHTFAQQWATGDGPQAGATARWLELFAAIRPDVLTARYNLLSPLYTPHEPDIFTFARARGVGVLIKQALGQGLLLATTPPGRAARYTTADHRSTDPMFTPAARRELHTRLAPLRARFGDTPAGLARVALRYALQHAPDAAVLVGFRNADQIHTTTTCLGEPLTPAEISEIRAALHPAARHQ